MTIDRAIEILDPEHREHYEDIEVVNEACRMGMEALRFMKAEKGEPVQENVKCPCETCEVRKDYARIFDAHFWGEDCPYVCERYDRWEAGNGQT